MSYKIRIIYTLYINFRIFYLFKKELTLIYKCILIEYIAITLVSYYVSVFVTLVNQYKYLLDGL